jgi:putative transcriptional regulator
LDLSSDAAGVVDRVASLRVFAGYAGWGPGQLEGELEMGGWLVLNAHPDDAFSDDPRGLWRRVLRRQRAEVAVLSSFPLDPSTN